MTSQQSQAISTAILAYLIKHKYSRVYLTKLRQILLAPLDREKLLLTLNAVPMEFYERAQSHIERAQKYNIELCSLLDEAYPRRLREIHDPPPVLFIRGKLRPRGFCVAIVGARKATEYGREVAYQLAKDLNASSALIVSGLALGIDSAAHRGSIAANGGNSGVAVLGSGLLQLYPARNKPLANAILDTGGAIVSEYLPESKPRQHFFRERNRLISGLADAVVVVEAGKRSGSLITARLAGEQGREVLAVPGSVLSPLSEGANALLTDGAKPARNADDVISAIPKYCFHRAKLTGEMPVNESEIEGPQEGQDLILEALRNKESLHIDQLLAESSLSLEQLIQRLSRLEVMGKVYRYPGNYFSTSPFVDIRGVV